MSEEITGEQLERAAYNDNTAGKKPCYICGDYYHPDGPDALYESDSGKTVCECCLSQTVKYNVQQLRNDSRWYGFFELGSEEFSTEWMTTRKKAKDALMEAIEKLHPDIERVEK